MKKILIVSYAFPPDRNSQANHVNGITNLLSEDNIVDVITAGTMKEISRKGNKTIFNVNMGKLHLVHKNVSRQNTNNSIKKKSGIVTRLKKCLIPDPVIDWYPQVIGFYNSNLIDNYDFIIGIATPYTDLIIAKKIYEMNRKKNDSAKLILVYADPWINEISIRKTGLRRAIEKVIEISILKKSHKVFMVTENAMNEYKRLFPFLKNKIDYYYLGHSFDITSQFVDHNKDVKIKYFGSIQGVHRDPYIFLEALNKEKYINRITVEFFLLPNESHEAIETYISKSLFLKNIVSLHPSLPYSDMIDEIKKGGYCLIFGNNSNLQIPGKLFDYIGLGANVIYIKKEMNMEIEKIINNYRGDIVLNDLSEIEKYMDYLIEKKTDKSVNYQTRLDMYSINCYKKLKEEISNN